VDVGQRLDEHRRALRRGVEDGGHDVPLFSSM
jgi:hypothetical protein